MVWTVHNVVLARGALVPPHPVGRAPAADAQHRRHPRADRGRTRRPRARAYPELAATPGAVTRHGHYRDAYDFSVSRAEARDRLGLPADAKVVASVGQIRDYKNVPHLVRTFRETDADAVLMVSGSAPKPLAAQIRDSAGEDPRVRLDLRFLPDDELPTLLAAADLVVLPYRRIQNSGSAILALSANRPVLVPDLGAMRELQADVGGEWVRLYDGELAAEDLLASLDWARAPIREDAPGCVLVRLGRDRREHDGGVRGVSPKVTSAKYGLRTVGREGN